MAKLVEQYIDIAKMCIRDRVVSVGRPYAVNNSVSALLTPNLQIPALSAAFVTSAMPIATALP